MVRGCQKFCIFFHMLFRTHFFSLSLRYLKFCLLSVFLSRDPRHNSARATHTTGRYVAEVNTDLFPKTNSLNFERISFLFRKSAGDNFNFYGRTFATNFVLYCLMMIVSARHVVGALPMPLADIETFVSVQSPMFVNVK